MSRKAPKKSAQKRTAYIADFFKQEGPIANSVTKRLRKDLEKEKEREEEIEIDKKITEIKEKNANLEKDQNGGEKTEINVVVLKKNYTELKEKNAKLEKDNKDLKYLLNKATKINLQKDLLLEQNKKIISDKELLIEELNKRISGNNGVCVQHGVEKDGLLFKEFETELGLDDLVCLRSIGDHKQKDSNFVLKCLEILYKGNESILHERSAKKSTATKQQVTPKKTQLIDKLFSARLSSLNLSDQDRNERKLRFRQLLSNGIQVIKKKLPKPTNQLTIGGTDNREETNVSHQICSSSSSSSNDFHSPQSGLQNL